MLSGFCILEEAIDFDRAGVSCTRESKSRIEAVSV